MPMIARTCTTLILALGLLACADRQADIDEDVPRIRCSYIAVYIYHDDGSRTRLVDPRTGDSHTKVCTCAGPDEWLEPDYRDMINDMAYEECLSLVDLLGYDAANSNCESDWLDKHWAKAFGLAEHDFAGTPAPCEEIGGGCGVQ